MQTGIVRLSLTACVSAALAAALVSQAVPAPAARPIVATVKAPS